MCVQKELRTGSNRLAEGCSKALVAHDDDMVRCITEPSCAAGIAKSLGLKRTRVEVDIPTPSGQQTCRIHPEHCYRLQAEAMRGRNLDQIARLLW